MRRICSLEIALYMGRVRIRLRMLTCRFLEDTNIIHISQSFFLLKPITAVTNDCSDSDEESGTKSEGSGAKDERNVRTFSHTPAVDSV